VARAEPWSTYSRACFGSASSVATRSCLPMLITENDATPRMSARIAGTTVDNWVGYWHPQGSEVSRLWSGAFDGHRILIDVSHVKRRMPNATPLSSAQSGRRDIARDLCRGDRQTRCRHHRSRRGRPGRQEGARWRRASVPEPLR